MEQRKRLRGYAVRNKILRKMGFMNYKDYLKSPIWKTIRDGHLRMWPRCYGCDSKAQTVHHGRYTWKNLFGASRQYLFSICHSCHKKCEFTEEGSKRRVRTAMSSLKEIRRENNLPVINQDHPNNYNPALDETFKRSLV